MDQSSILDYMRTALVLFGTIAGPPLAAAVGVGLLIGLVQAITQIQDQTLPLTFKIVAVLATMAMMAGVLFPPLLVYAERVFDDFPTLTRL